MPEVISPCRFCGEKYNEKAPMLYVESVDCEEDGCFVVCKNCGARGPVSYVEDDPTPGEIEKAEESAISAWNTLSLDLTWTHEPPTQSTWYARRERRSEVDAWGWPKFSWVLCPEDISASPLIQWSNRPFTLPVNG